ncbi:MAG: ATP-binding protein [Lachnospiraceae bacterium]|nr:ATP-binding protein [Lachnospiraceae bacterium]MBQ4304885.1 ATP-binding protein [Lachnospiraceae bacterium]MBQ5361515.1 ATP-binding protein [Lachnospiraceae bacterium]
MEALRIKALTDNLDRVLQYVDTALELMGCSMKNQIQIDMAVEELFVNIAHYAYKGTAGDAVILAGPDPKTGILRITFRDWGVPFDPLAKTDPDISLSVEEREIGGLGIFMAKKIMDTMDYKYENGQNVLTMTKKIG